MCKQLILFAAILLVSVRLSGAAAASLVTKCKAEDSKCLKESAQALIPTFASGIPEFGVETLDPLSIDAIDASTKNLKFTLKDIVVKGLKDCHIRKVQRDVAKSKLAGKLQCDVINLDGQYELKGNVLILPIEGKGPIHVKLRKIIIFVEADLEDKNLQDGKIHWIVKSWRHSFDLKDKSDVEFKNLFNGNELLGMAARELIANHGNEVVYEIGPPVIEAIISRVVDNIKAFFKALSVEDLALD